MTYLTAMLTLGFVIAIFLIDWRRRVWKGRSQRLQRAADKAIQELRRVCVERAKEQAEWLEIIGRD